MGVFLGCAEVMDAFRTKGLSYRWYDLQKMRLGPPGFQTGHPIGHDKDHGVRCEYPSQLGDVREEAPGRRMA